MDKRVNKSVEEYVSKFKHDICNKMNELNFDELSKPKLNDLIEFVYEYHRLTFTKSDLEKRKRLKNAIPVENRCNARRANNEQCTRRRKDGSECCGTHTKGTPNGIVQGDVNECSKKLDVVASEIGGIVYYIDTYNNIYRNEDILLNKENPRIVGKRTLVNGAPVIKLLDN